MKEKELRERGEALSKRETVPSQTVIPDPEVAAKLDEYPKIKEKLEAKDKEINDLKEAHEIVRRDLHSQNAEMKQNINALTTEKSNLEKDKSHLVGKLDNLKNSLETSKKEVEHLNKENQNFTIEKSKFDAEVARLKEEVKRLNEIEGLPKDAAMKALNDQLNSALKSYNDEKIKSERLIANLEENTEKLEKERKKTLTLGDENHRLADELEQAKAKHEDELRKKNDEYILSLEGKAKESEEASRKLNHEITDLKLRIVNVGQAHQKVQEELAKRDETIQTLETNLQKILALEADLREAGEKHRKALEERNGVIQTLTNEVEREGDIVKELELERGQLKNELDEVRKNHEKALSSLAAGDKDSETLNEELESLRTLLKGKNNEVGKLTSELANKVGELKKESENFKGLGQKISTLNDSLESTTKLNVKLQQDLKVKNDDIETLKGELEKLGDKMERDNQIQAAVLESKEQSLVTEKATSSKLKQELEEKIREIVSLVRINKNLNEELLSAYHDLVAEERRTFSKFKS